MDDLKQDLFRLFQGKPSLLILIHPDPDSIGSALGLERLVARRCRRVVIAYDEAIKRLQNRAMVRLLKIKMLNVKDIRLKDFDLVGITDGQRNHFPMLARKKVDLCIDHHPITAKADYRFADIRPDIGATCSLLAEYLQKAGIKPSKRLATALCYGIKTDTDNFSRRVHHLDAIAFSWLFPLADYYLLQAIDQVEIPFAEIKYFQRAMQRLKLKQKSVFLHLGEVPNPDILVIIADFLIRVQGIEMVAVSGFEAKRLIVIFRSSHPRRDIGKLAHLAFEPPGIAGGHRFLARAEIPLNSLPKSLLEADAEVLEDWLSQRLRFAERKMRSCCEKAL